MTTEDNFDDLIKNNRPLPPQAPGGEMRRVIQQVQEPTLWPRLKNWSLSTAMAACLVLVLVHYWPPAFTPNDSAELETFLAETQVEMMDPAAAYGGAETDDSWDMYAAL